MRGTGGIVVILSATGTTLNIESFMGSIMCPGVSVSNSVMLVTWRWLWNAAARCRRHWTGRDWRTSDVDVRDALGVAVGVCHRHRHAQSVVSVDLLRRPRQRI